VPLFIMTMKPSQCILFMMLSSIAMWSSYHYSYMQAIGNNSNKSKLHSQRN